jgi:hypothetical protein
MREGNLNAQNMHPDILNKRRQCGRMMRGRSQIGRWGNSMRRPTLWVICVILTGCTTARPIGLPSGDQGEIIRCNGIQHSLEDCYIKAGEVCPNGYDVLTGGETFGPNSKLAALGGNNVGAIDRSLIVHCH